MRTLIFQTLSADSDVIAIFGDPVRLYQWGSLGHNDLPAKPTFPFLLTMEQPATVNQEIRDTAPKSQRRNFQIACYDEHGAGYVRIEQGLYVVRDTLLMLKGRVSPTGARCTDIRWTGFSVDSKDVELQANVKWATFSLVVSQ